MYQGALPDAFPIFNARLTKNAAQINVELSPVQKPVFSVQAMGIKDHKMVTE